MWARLLLALIVISAAALQRAGLAQADTTDAGSPVRVPALAQRFTNLTDLPAAADYLEENLAQIAASGGPEIRALAVPSNPAEPLGALAERVFAEQSARIGFDALLVIAPRDQQARIVASERGAQALPEGARRWIIRDSVTPFLRDGNLTSAVDHGSNRIDEAFRGRLSPEAYLKGPAPDPSKVGADPRQSIPEVPELRARVQDLSGTLSTEEIGEFERELAGLESRKGAQAAVLIVPTTGQLTIEQYATEVFDRWQLGRKGVDDGLLLLVAKNDRKLRIEVGYGLEGAIPDAVASRVIFEHIRPHFRRGEFFEGVQAGLVQIVRLIEGQALPEAAPQHGMLAGDFAEAAPYLGVIAALGLLAQFFVSATVAGAVAGLAAGAVIYAFGGDIGAAIFWALFIGALTGVFTGIVKGARSSRSSGGGSFRASGSSGFSGGGGSSGGGGASGNW